jgi:hypothetical protein
VAPHPPVFVSPPLLGVRVAAPLPVVIVSADEPPTTTVRAPVSVPAARLPVMVIVSALFPVRVSELALPSALASTVSPAIPVSLIVVLPIPVMTFVMPALDAAVSGSQCWR